MKSDTMSNQENELTAKAGFTILEVTLVTAFIALLLIAIATIFMNISALYQKGATLKSVNEVGRNLVTELTTSLNSSPAIDSVSLCTTLLDNDAARNNCLASGAYKYVFLSHNGRYYDEVTNSSDEPIQYGGIFCTGDYSYVWNTYYGRQTNAGGGQHLLKVKFSNGSREDDFKMIRFRDKTYRACSAKVNPNTYEADFSNNEIDVSTLSNGTNSGITTGDVEEGFLLASDIPLELYELIVFPAAQNSITLQSFLSGTFILATERGDVNIMRSGDYCDVTNNNGNGDGSGNLQNLGSNFNYCGINKFNFAARTAGNGV